MINQELVKKLASQLKKDGVDAIMIAPGADMVFLLGHKPLLCERYQALFVKGRINLLTGNSDVDVYGRISKLVENMSGKFANPVPPTIMTSYSSVDNLFFDDFYCAVPYGDLSKIPDIKGQSRIFAVKISGNVNNVKSVKSFKWHTLKTDYEAPLPFGHD